jgi:hypothetical protein
VDKSLQDQIVLVIGAAGGTVAILERLAAEGV